MTSFKDRSRQLTREQLHRVNQRLALSYRTADEDGRARIIATWTAINWRWLTAWPYRFQSDAEKREAAHEFILRLPQAFEAYRETSGSLMGYLFWWKHAALTAVTAARTVVRARTNASVARKRHILALQDIEDSLAGHRTLESAALAALIQERLRLLQLIQCVAQPQSVSLDSPNEEGHTVLDWLPAEEQEEEAENPDQALSPILAHLPEREARIMRMYFGESRMHMREIAAAEGISHERVRQILNRAKAALRKVLRP